MEGEGIMLQQEAEVEVGKVAPTRTHLVTRFRSRGSAGSADPRAIG